MMSSFSLADPPSLSDLRVFLGRSARVEDGAVRLLAQDRILAAYTAILQPRGLLDRSSTVLGVSIVWGGLSIIDYDACHETARATRRAR